MLVLALALPAGAMAAPQGTQTRLTAQTRDANGRTQAVLQVSVTGEDGAAAQGAVVIEDRGKPLAGAGLSAEGTATLRVGLLPGAHSLQAVYLGDGAHLGSKSEMSGVTAQTSSQPGFTVAVSPAALTLTAGQSGQATVSLTPVNASALSAPMFVTISCAGNPDQSSCAFTPENIEILPNATAPVTSAMLVSTQAAGTRAMAQPGTGRNGVAWAVMLPGVLTLGGIAFGARRRRWLSRLSVIALVGLVSMVGMTACAPRYNYFNHGPPYNLPTPAGTYTLQVTAQSSNGVTATTESTNFVLTVK